jgi:outer membrane protein OmpA-like peptidoglycan-associated protein
MAGNLTEPRKNKRRWLLSAATGAVIAVAAVAFFWYTADRLKEIEQRMLHAEERSQAILRQMTEYSREVELARQHTREAIRQTAESQAARSEAESRATRVEGEAEQARTQAQHARQELDDLRQRRNQEMERMQEALSRIAPTRKTPLGMVVELADDSFKFDFDQAVIRPENREMLSRIAGVLLASQGYRLSVYGHTDDVGTKEYNQTLSERRAQAVADYLMKAGVPSSIMSTKGYGKSSPRASGTTHDARQHNRRVEIGIVDTVIEYQQPIPAR